MMSTLLLIFWPLFEPTLEGHPSLGTTPRTSPPSFITCGRWYRQALLAAEVNALPPQIRNFREIEVQLYERAMTDDMVWMRNQARRRTRTRTRNRTRTRHTWWQTGTGDRDRLTETD